MPESKPDIYFNEDGVCNLCVAYENRTIETKAIQPLESDFIKIINKNRGKDKYDCLVMLSGGKDSTASLYYMVKRYNLRVLAFNFDHGFETEDARKNIENAVDILGVDFMTFKSNFMKEMFAKILASNSNVVVCHPCSIWYMQLAFDVAARYKIPMIVAGWTKGQSVNNNVKPGADKDEHALEFRQMAKATTDFLRTQLKDMPKYKDFPTSMEEVVKRARKKFKSIVVSPHWFLPFGPETYIEVIKNELKWKVPSLSYPKGSTNCSLNFISAFNSLKHFGYTHYHVEASKMIREKMISREDALRELAFDFDKELLNSVARDLGHEFE